MAEPVVVGPWVAEPVTEPVAEPVADGEALLLEPDEQYVFAKFKTARWMLVICKGIKRMMRKGAYSVDPPQNN